MAKGFVRLLGPVEFVDQDGNVVAVPSAAMRRLLAVLAISEGRVLRGEYLVNLLGVSPGALRTTVSRLRSRIGEDSLRTDPLGYRLACDVDSAMFCELLGVDGRADPLARAEEALSLWKAAAAIEEFRHEPWAEIEATRLEELRLVVIEELAELLIARARAGEAVAMLEAHIANHPFRDRARGLLMEALAGDGRQADALRAFQDYRTFLGDEAGTEPSAHVRSIEQRVAVGWHDVEGSAHAGPRRRDPSSSPGSTGRVQPGCSGTTSTPSTSHAGMTRRDNGSATRLSSLSRSPQWAS